MNTTTHSGFMSGFLAVCALMAGTPALAQEQQVVPRAASATWAELLTLQAVMPLDTPRAAPHMPVPVGGPIAADQLTGERRLKGESDEAPSMPAACPSLGAEPGLGTNFQGLGDNNASIPPDTMGGVGPNHVMTTLNSQVRIADKAGSVNSTVSLATFFAPAGVTDVFDPVVHYDALSGRWFFVVAAQRQSATSSVVMAVSRTDNPTGVWDYYQLDADAADVNWADYEKFGMNDTWVAITANMYSNAGSNWAGVRMWVIAKSTCLSNGGALTLTNFLPGFDTAGTASGSTLRPCLYLDSNASTLYIVDYTGFYLASAPYTPLLRVSRITGTAAAPAWSVLPGSIFSGSGLFEVDNTFSTTIPGASQQGSAQLIDTGDFRLQSAVYRNGRIWTTHTVGLPGPANNASPTRAAVAWYELTPSSNPIVQSGLIDGGGAVHHFYPSIAVNCGNDAMIGFSRSSAAQFASANFAIRLAGDSPGTMGPVRTLKAGEAPYFKTFGGPRNRWGDYSATCVDPSDDRTLWTLQEYAALPSGGWDRWGVWWGKAGINGLPPGIIWVDFGYIGLETGSINQPFNTLPEGLAAVAPGGTIRFRSGGSSPMPLTINQSVMLEAPYGVVTIGN